MADLRDTWRYPATVASSYQPKRVLRLHGKQPGIEVHHSVTKQSRNAAELREQVRSIWRDHVQLRGWSDAFYGYFIGGDGSLAWGRGAGVGTSSALTPVTVCLIGDFSTLRPTPAALHTLDALRRYLIASGSIGSNISYHNDRGGSACPGAAGEETVRAYFAAGAPYPPPAAPGAGAWTPPPTIAAGDRGDVVRWLQGMLTGLGYGVVLGRIDGVFGSKTTDAVRRYQAKAGLTVDGIVGPSTWAALAGR